MVLRAQGKTRTAIALLDDVLRREPENLSGVGACSPRSHPGTIGRWPGAWRRRGGGSTRWALGALTSASTSSAPARTTAGSVTAGSCQSQSIEACRNQASSAAAGPAAASGRVRSAPRAAAATPPASSPKASSPTQPELGGDLELERVHVLHRLGDRALLQPVDAETARAEARERVVGEGAGDRRASTRSGSS